MDRSIISAVLFDLDGTLLDTAPDLVGALNHLRALEGLAPVAVDAYRRFVSQGALGLIRAGMPDSDEQVREQRRKLFLQYYEQNLYGNTSPFDGVELTLSALGDHSIPWGVVTNKPEYLTHPIIEAVGWGDSAGCVICGDTLAHSKPHPAPVLKACELLGVAPARAIMVGDDPRDLEAGEAAGTKTALAAYGYGAREVLESGQSLQFIFERPEDILQLDALGLARP